MANGGRSSRSASGPLVSPPQPYGGVWKAGVRLSGLSPVKAPTHSPLWFVGVPVRRAVGSVVSALVRFAWPTVLWSVCPSSLRARGRAGWCAASRALPERAYMCTRLARDPRGAPGAFQGGLRRCPVLSVGGVSRFSDVVCLLCAVRPFSGACRSARGVSCGVKTKTPRKKGVEAGSLWVPPP